MDSNKGNSGIGGFYFKQAILLLVTIALFIFFTIPFLKTLKAAVVPGELEANIKQAKELEINLDSTRAKMLMGAGDEEMQEKLKKRIQDLERQLAEKDMANKNLQAGVQTLLQLVKAPGAQPVPEFWQKIPEIIAKILGCIGSMFSGALFVYTWLKRRRETEPVR